MSKNYPFFVETERGEARIYHETGHFYVLQFPDVPGRSFIGVFPGRSLFPKKKYGVKALVDVYPNINDAIDAADELEEMEDYTTLHQGTKPIHEGIEVFPKYDKLSLYNIDSKTIVPSKKYPAKTAESIWLAKQKWSKEDILNALPMAVGSIKFAIAKFEAAGEYDEKVRHSLEQDLIRQIKADFLGKGGIFVSGKHEAIEKQASDIIDKIEDELNIKGNDVVITKAISEFDDEYFEELGKEQKEPPESEQITYGKGVE